MYVCMNDRTFITIYIPVYICTSYIHNYTTCIYIYSCFYAYLCLLNNFLLFSLSLKYISHNTKTELMLSSPELPYTKHINRNTILSNHLYWFVYNYIFISWENLCIHVHIYIYIYIYIYNIYTNSGVWVGSCIAPNSVSPNR